VADDNDDLGLTEKSFPIHTLKTLRAHKVDPTKYVMGTSGFMRKGAGTLLIGSYSMGKSVFVMQLAASLACGMDFLGIMKVPKPRNVLILQAENDEDVMKRDLEGIVKNLKMDESLVNKNLKMVHVYGTSDIRFVSYLEKMMMEYKPEVTMIDPYQSFATGNLNSTESFDLWATIVDQLIREYQSSLLLVAHKGKPRDTSEWDIREFGYQQLGTSKQINWARASMELNYIKGDMKRYSLTIGKNPDSLGLEDSDGQTVNKIYIEHSDNKREPYWALSKDQSATMKGSEARLIEEMMLKNPDMKNVDIISKIKMEHHGLEVSKQNVANVRARLKRQKKIKGGKK
jgi:hypothetical protein